MNKVDFTLKNGRVERMHPKIAELLQRKGKGTYQTRVVEHAPQRAVLTPEPPRVPVEEPLLPPPVVHDQAEGPADPVDAAPEPIDLASLSVEQLREYAKRQGVPVHHRAGAKTIIDAIENKA